MQARDVKNAADARRIVEARGLTHIKLGLVVETCHRLTVMYSGEAVEAGDIGSVLNRPRV